MFQRTFTGRLTPYTKTRNDYYYVPFELPAPARRLTVRYDYSARMHHGETEGGNVIDIGLFGPGGAHFPGGEGFRGWSGSDRRTFTVGPEEATPGYLPGPLPAGRYQVILGLYRIWSDGADYEVEIEAELEEPVEEAADEAPTPRPQGRSTSPAAKRARRAALRYWAKTPSDESESTIWLKGDLQSHTHHSDGKGSPQVLAGKARALGLDFLAITDHNTVSHHADVERLSDEELLLIAGQEVTTYYGHMNVWGTSRWCDFRCRSDEEMAAVIALAHAHGGVCSVNHPKTGGPAWEYGLESIHTLPVDAMEVWQGPWPNRNEESLALWDELLREGRRLPAVGGSDYHCASGEETGFLRLSQPTTWVKATGRSAGEVLEAISAGRASISARPDGPRLDLSATVAEAGDGAAQMGQALSLGPGQTAEVTVAVSGGAGLTLRLVSEAGAVHEEKLDGDEETVVVALAARRYIRAELVGDMPAEDLPPYAPADLDLRDWRWALSNPIYID